jgi:hypothetical protein
VGLIQHEKGLALSLVGLIQHEKGLALRTNGKISSSMKKGWH